MQRCFLIFGLTAMFSVCLHAAAPLSTIAQIHQLSPEQAGEGISVRIKAIVTYYEPSEYILFVQDRTGSIFIRTHRVLPFAIGDRIEVIGATATSYHVVVASDNMRRLGKARLPSPAPATFTELMAGERDCAYVEVSGKVLSASMQLAAGPPFLLLELLMDGGTVDAHISNPGSLDPHKLLDSRVTLTGVSGGRFDGKFQLVGANLYLSSPEEVRVTAPAAVDPLSLPLTPIDQIMSSYNVVERSRRLRIHGSVTLYEPGSQIAIEDHGQAAVVHTHQNTPLSIGDIVDATGFADANDYSESLDYGQFSRIGQKAVISPLPVTWSEAITGQYANNLISLKGRLIEQVHEPSQDTLFVDSEGHVFSAVLLHSEDATARLASFRPGSKIRISGVCFIRKGGPWKNAVGFELHLRNASDVGVLALSSWWTVPHLVYITAALALLILASVAWVVLLRRRVHKQTQVIRHGMEEEAIRERRQMFLEKQRSRVLEAINSLRPLDQVITMITELITQQMDGLQCWCELAADGAVAGVAPKIPDPAALADTHAGERTRRTFRRDILSSAGHRLGALVLVWDPGKKPLSLRSELLDMGVSLAALAIDNRRLYEGLVRRSEYDQLTEVPNRFFLETRLKQVLANARRERRHFALLYVDLDRFKAINDLYGHRFGDIYLQHVARRLSEKLRAEDTLARVGGDEFIVLIPKVRDRTEAEEITNRLAGCFDSPFRIDGRTITGSASIGLALYPEDGEDEDQMKRFADSAMYASKHSFSWLGSTE